MKGLRWILSMVLMVCSMLSVQAHDYYVSIAIMDYNSQSKSIELTFKFIAHDVEHAFEVQHFGQLKLGTEKEHPQADSLLSNYIREHFRIQVEREQLHPKYVGKEVGLDESLFVYMEIPNVSVPREFKLFNNCLTEVFDAQENINHINFGKEQLSITLNSQATSKEIKIQ